MLYYPYFCYLIQRYRRIFRHSWTWTVKNKRCSGAVTHRHTQHTHTHTRHTHGTHTAIKIRVEYWLGRWMTTSHHRWKLYLALLGYRPAVNLIYHRTFILLLNHSKLNALKAIRLFIPAVVTNWFNNTLRERLKWQHISARKNFQKSIWIQRIL